VQLDAILLMLKCPLEQFVQTIEPLAEAYFPSLQAVQAVEPLLAAKKPTGQSTHPSPLRATLYFPLEQGTQGLL